MNHTYLGYFQPFESQHKDKIVHRAQFFTDLQNGTLPQVALIEPDGADEHPQTDLQVGAQEVARILKTFMDSSAWKDSVFILTYDEGGDFYDHVAPQPAVLPDNIAPRFLKPSDIPGPYVMAGHSSGGFTVWVFAAAYPTEVVGVRLIDSTTPGEGTQAEAPTSTGGLSGGDRPFVSSSN